jgi:L-malate glycosyltransferase
MKICFLGDASSIHMQRWIHAFAERGHQISLLSFQPWREPIEHVDFIHLRPLPPKELALKKLPGVRSLEYWFRTTHLVRQSLAQLQPELVHAHYINVYGHLAFLSGWRPYLLTAWGSDLYLHASRSLPNRLLTRLALRQAALITSDSQDLLYLATHLSADPNILHLIQFGVDARIFYPRTEKTVLRSKWRLCEHEIVIFSPRSLNPHYNIDVIVRSFVSLKKNFPQAKLILKDTSDEDPYRAHILQLIIDMGIQDIVMWIPYIPLSDMAELYNMADAVVSLAKTDGTPVSVLEALACESVVLASDLPSLREWIVDGQNGYLANPANPVEVEMKLMQALQMEENQRQAFSRINRSIILERGDHAMNMNNMEKLYKSLL